MRQTCLLLLSLLPTLPAQDLAVAPPASSATALVAGAPQLAGAAPAALPSLVVAMTVIDVRTDCQPHFPGMGAGATLGVSGGAPPAVSLITLNYAIPQPAGWRILAIDNTTARTAVTASGEDLAGVAVPPDGRRRAARRATWLFHDPFSPIYTQAPGELHYGSCVLAAPLTPAAQFKTVTLQASLLLVSDADLHHESLPLSLGSSAQVVDVPGVQLSFTPTLSSVVRVETTRNSKPLVMSLGFFNAAHQPLAVISRTGPDANKMDLRCQEAPTTVEVTCLTGAQRATITMSFDGLTVVGQNAPALVGPKPLATVVLAAVPDLPAEIVAAFGADTVLPPARPAPPAPTPHNSNF